MVESASVFVAGALPKFSSQKFNSLHTLPGGGVLGRRPSILIVAQDLID